MQQVFVTETGRVYCAVRTGSLYIIQRNLSLYRIILEREELVDCSRLMVCHEHHQRSGLQNTETITR